MALEAGSRLGHYDVTALLGEGGMGQVWQATDTQLNRQVALKILPDGFAADPDRLARFTREAQILASLNHPNIAAIFGIEEAEGQRALVLELVEGPTLADRIAKGPIPLDEALPIAKQIAEALEAAHEAGVIHRDLKPANIKVREDGTVKVLDFGLAKALQPEPEGDPSDSPTLTAAATQMGVIMGTAAYMAPEQAKGKVADKRADVWAFGVVLFEMLTGRRAFEGGDISEVLAGVIKSEPDWDALPTALPPALVTYLRRCLQKDARERIRDIGDVRLAMGGAFDLTAPPPATPVTVPQLQVWQRPIPAAIVALVTAAVAGLTVWTLARPDVISDATIARFAIEAASSVPNEFALSPDRRHVAFVGGSVSRQLWIRSIDALEPRALPRTEGAFYPFWSPDSRFIGFFAGGALKKVDVTGGPPETLSDAAPPSVSLGGTWNQDGVIVFASSFGGGRRLYRVPAAGGEPTPVTEESSAATSSIWPQFLPDGRHFLFLSVVGPGSDDNGISDRRHRDRGRAGQGAPAGHHASGSQAGQHHADHGWGQAPGLRVGEAEAGGGGGCAHGAAHAECGPDGRGRDSRHAAIHGAGAVGGEGGRRPNGHLRVWGAGLRDGDREEGVRGGQSGEFDRSDSEGSAGRDLYASTVHAAVVGSHCLNLPGEGTR